MPATLISLHHPTSLWTGSCRKIGTYFDHYRESSFHLGEFVETVGNYQDSDLSVFVSHPHLANPLWVKESLEQLAPDRHKIWIYLQEETGLIGHKALSDRVWAQVVDGMFTATAYHSWYATTQFGFPKDKIQIVGHPISVPRFVEERHKDNICMVLDLEQDKLDHFDFALDVLEIFDEAVADIMAEEGHVGTRCFVRMCLDLKPIKSSKWRVRTGRLDQLISRSMGRMIQVETTTTFAKSLEVASIVWAPAIRVSFDPVIASCVIGGAHPVVPAEGCYMEMMQIQHSGNRYTFEPKNIDSCVDALIRALKSPSPPRTYIEEFANPEGKMAKAMLA